MSDKKQLVTMLEQEFNRWQELLAGLTDQQITAPQLEGGWSIKDVIAHLRAWQQRSIARMEAGLHNREPEFPLWIPGVDPDAEDNPAQVNNWIYETYRDQTWASVHRAWREGFARFIELAEAIPEADLLAAGKYPWLDGDPLSVVLQSSYEHHHDEHYEPLVARLRSQ